MTEPTYDDTNVTYDSITITYEGVGGTRPEPARRILWGSRPGRFVPNVRFTKDARARIR